MNRSKRLAFAGAAVVALSWGVVANAQDAQAPPSKGEAAAGDQAFGGVAEVIVTAQKRSENLQKTPVAVAAVDADTLSRAGVHNFTNIDRVIPDVRVTQIVAAATISIRGVFPTDLSPTSEQPNAVHIDGAYIAKATALQGMFFDIQRLEVLKGPQGTLYGRNATAGAVNIITNKPVLGEYQAQGEVEAGSYDLLRVDGALNIPVSEKVGLRAAFHTYSHDGYYRTTGLDDANERSGRVHLLWKLDDRQQLLLTADIEKNNNRGIGAINLIGFIPSPTQKSPPNLTSWNGQTTPFFIPPTRDNSFFYGDGRVFGFNSTVYGLAAQHDYEFDSATLTTQLAHRGQTEHIALTGGAGTIGGLTQNSTKFLSDSLEVRLTSKSTRPLQWVGGLYAFTERSSGGIVSYSDLNPATVPGLGFPNPYERAWSLAAFAQATYTPPQLERLHVTLGGRLTWDHKHTLTETVLANVLIPGTTVDSAKSWRRATWRAALAYDVTEQSMLYGSISTGYRAGGFGFGLGRSPEYQPETLTAYEIGLKNRFFGNRLQLNLEGFYYDYRDYEQVIVIFRPAGVEIGVHSAPKAHYMGASFDAQLALTQHDRLAANIALLHARFGANNQGLEDPQLFDYTRTAFNGVPRYQGSASYTHSWEMLGGRFDAEASIQFRGKIMLVNEFRNTSYAVKYADKPFQQYDLSLRYAPDGGKWNLTGYVHNLTNELSLSNAAYGTGDGLLSGSFLPPRTWGVILGAKF